MNITQYAIEKNRVTAVLLLLVFTVGIATYLQLPKAEDPGFTIRTALVTTRFPGAGPERMEQLVTDKIEKVVQEIAELDYVNSISRTGLSLVYVNIKESYRDMPPIWDNLRRKIDKIRGDLPAGIYGPHVDDEFGDVFGQIITVIGEGYSYAELKDVADTVRDELLRIEDVSKVEIYGAQEEKIFVEYNNARLVEIGLSPAQLAGALASTNIINPGGDISTDMEQIVLEPTGNFESVSELKRTIIQVPGSTDVLFLEDFAEVHRGYIDPPRAKMRANGVPCLGLAISMREGGNIITLGRAVKALMGQLQATYPIGIEFDFVAFQPGMVQNKVNNFMENLYQAVGIVMLVMLLTLGLRTGLVVASLIPMAILMSFILMGLFGVGIDQISLAALIIALGMLVDNAIVMSESIMVQMEAGEKPVKAAIQSAGELRVPLLISSLTTCAAFAPFCLAKSSMGEYVGNLFVVVTMTLLCSWILAITMIPLLCVTFIRVKPKETGVLAYNSRFYRWYRGVIILLLKNRIASLVLMALVFTGAMAAFGIVPKIFMPENDAPVMTAEFRLPMGTPIGRTEAVVNEIETFMKNECMAADGKEGIVNWATFIGQGAPRFVLSFDPESFATEYAMMLINTTSDTVINTALIPGIEAFLNENLPDVIPQIKALSLGVSVKYPLEFRISGKENDTLFSVVQGVKAHLETIAGVKNITDNWGPRTKKLMVNINQPRVRRARLTSQEVAESLKANLSGIETTQYREADKVIPVMLRSVSAERKDIGKLESLNVFSANTGVSVPLKQVADIEVVWQPAKILRRDRLRTVTVQAGLSPGTSAIAVTGEVARWLSEEQKDWALGNRYEIGGENENSDESSQSIIEQLPLAGLIIIFLLVFQFNSIRRPAIIIITIPMGIIGVVIGLIVMKSYFGFMTLLGVVSLSGIVINNAIVLLDRIKIEIEENGLAPPQAIVESAQKRLRPILLTTATTIGGLLPLYINGGPMWE
ncbi:MAG: efflux RND transporter permease subunit, partial [Deltaproteobacteria bacterium]|nr:efflux RND transporter permease subunit [Deltaproteobacteria bacterium]